MFWAINERFNVEDQVVRAVCHEITRGVWSRGDAVPSPHVLAKERILNPHVVESAYAKLVKAGLLVALSGGDYQTADEAQRLARGRLLEWAEEEVRDLSGSLRRAGLSREEVERIFRQARDV